MTIEKIIKNIGLGEYINALLVQNSVRNAMLIQPADYSEAKSSNKKTKSILNNLKKEFPDLIQTENYQGIILSLKDYKNININSEKIGKILDYPCYKDFQYIINNPKESSITFELVVYFNNGKFPLQIFANRCKDDSSYSKMKNMANKATKVLKLDKNIGNIIDKVDVNKIEFIPTHVISDKLIKNKKLNKNEENELRNILYNIGFSPEFYFYEFDYKNKIHVGVLLTLLSYSNNPLIEPFCPLQNYPKQDKEVTKLTEAWEKELIEILNKNNMEK